MPPALPRLRRRLTLVLPDPVPARIPSRGPGELRALPEELPFVSHLRLLLPDLRDVLPTPERLLFLRTRALRTGRRLPARLPEGLLRGRGDLGVPEVQPRLLSLHGLVLLGLHPRVPARHRRAVRLPVRVSARGRDLRPLLPARHLRVLLLLSPVFCALPDLFRGVLLGVHLLLLGLLPEPTHARVRHDLPTELLRERRLQFLQHVHRTLWSKRYKKRGVGKSFVFIFFAWGNNPTLSGIS